MDQDRISGPWFAELVKKDLNRFIISDRGCTALSGLPQTLKIAKQAAIS
jgi:hypothetical protein